MAIVLAGLPLVGAAGLWDEVKEGVSKGADAVGSAVSSGAEAVTDAAKPRRTRQQVDEMAAATLARLFTVKPDARTLYDQAYGYAVFDTRKLSLLITSGFGVGVAVIKETGEPTYMKMGTGGVNVGIGAQLYQLVFLFENEARFRDFVDKGWDAGVGGSAVVADEGANLGATYKNGLAIYQFTDKGLMLAVDLTGTKYWRDDELNDQLR